MRLETLRLTLRWFSLEDALEVRRMAGDPAIAATTLVIPHPYPEGAAEQWIATHEPARLENKSFDFALEEKTSKRLMGCVSLMISAEHERGMLGYWVGKDFWNEGFCTEAVRKVIEFGFLERKLQRVWAYHFADNPASGKVLEKAGMKYEGTLRGHVMKNGVYKDCTHLGILASEYNLR